MLETQTSLRGLAAVVRLKTDVLRQLARSRSEEWQRHIDRFIEAVGASELEDPSALFVLLADLVEEIRALLGQDALADCTSGGRSTASTPEAQSRNDVLAQFRAELGELLAPIARTRQFASPLVAQMLHLVEERYAEPLTLEVIATALGRSKGYLATLFREQTGQSVHGFVTQLRLHHAAALIRAGEKIEVVSLLVGYRSKKNFYRHFKEQYRVTPLAYRTAVLGLTPPSSCKARVGQ
jgi:AraC-like DNA-binding protein